MVKQVLVSHFVKQPFNGGAQFVSHFEKHGLLDRFLVVSRTCLIKQPLHNLLVVVCLLGWPLHHLLAVVCLLGWPLHLLGQPPNLHLKVKQLHFLNRLFDVKQLHFVNRLLKVKLPVKQLHFLLSKVQNVLHWFLVGL